MTVLLPDFTAKRCEHLVFCGYFAPSVVPHERFPVKDTLEFGRYKRGGTAVAMTLFCQPPEDRTGAHVHIDFLAGKRRKQVVEKRQPVLKIDQVAEALSQLGDHDVLADISGYYTVSKDELPAAIRYAMAPSEAGGIRLKMLSGVYAVRGAPISSIRWGPGQQPEQFNVVLEFEAKGRIKSDTFDKFLNTFESAFSVLFSREQTEASGE